MILFLKIPGTLYLIIDNAAMAIYHFPMARIARVAVPGLPHHITQRGLGLRRECAKTGKLDTRFHRWLLDAQDFRNIGDYGIGAHVSKDDANLVCDWA
jgi:hypothetical protein